MVVLGSCDVCVHLYWVFLNNGIPIFPGWVKAKKTSISFKQVSNNRDEWRGKSSYICFTLRTSMTPNLILRQWSPSEQQLRHKQIVFQPPAWSQLYPAHLVHPRSDEWGFKGAASQCNENQDGGGQPWTCTHLDDTHLLHLKKNIARCKNFSMLFTRSRGVKWVFSSSQNPESASIPQRLTSHITFGRCFYALEAGAADKNAWKQLSQSWMFK